MNRIEIMGLVDSGYAQILIREYLVQTPGPSQDTIYFSVHMEM